MLRRWLERRRAECSKIELDAAALVRRYPDLAYTFARELARASRASGERHGGQ